MLMLRTSCYSILISPILGSVIIGIYNVLHLGTVTVLRLMEVTFKLI